MQIMTAKVNRPIVNPVEIEVSHQPEGNESKNLKFYHQPKCYETKNLNISNNDQGSTKKTSFWKFLFGEKKCKICLQKKSNCECNVKKKMHNKKRQPGILKEIQNNGIYQGKCPLPLAQRGCGCHFYFCVDNKHKKTQLKNFTKRQQNESTKTSVDLSKQCCTKCAEDDLFQKEVPKVTIVCSEGDNSLLVSHSQESNVSTNNFSLMMTKKDFVENKSLQDQDSNIENNISIKTMPFSLTEPKEFLNQLQNVKTTLSNSYQMDKFNGQTEQKSSTKKEKNIINSKVSSKQNIDFNHECIKNDTIQKQCLPCKSSVDNQVKNTINKGQDNNRQYSFENIKTHYSVQPKTEQILHPKNVVFPVEIIPNIVSDPDIRSRGSRSRKKSYKRDTVQFSPEEESILKEYKGYENIRKRKSTAARSGAFVRNSFIMKRRQSQFDSGLSLIMMKLNTIEDKIAELEQKEVCKKKNLLMGISCNNKKSVVSVKFNKLKNKDITNKNNFMSMIPPKESCNKNVKIKSNNDNIYVNAPAEIGVIKQKARSSNNKYNNTHELDAHVIGARLDTNPKIIKCKNTKIVIEYPQHNQSQIKPLFGDKWRRISEELKFSQPNISNSCRNCLE